MCDYRSHLTTLPLSFFLLDLVMPAIVKPYHAKPTKVTRDKNRRVVRVAGPGLKMGKAGVKPGDPKPSGVGKVAEEGTMAAVWRGNAYRVKTKTPGGKSRLHGNNIVRVLKGHDADNKKVYKYVSAARWYNGVRAYQRNKKELIPYQKQSE